MTEANLVRSIIESLKKAFPRAVTFKHCDLMTAGIPDISVSFAEQNTWIEVKLFKEHETKSTVSKHFDRLQLATMRLLEAQGQAFYLIGEQRRAVGTALGLWSPATIAGVLEFPYPEVTLRPKASFKTTMTYVAQRIGETNGL